MTSSQSCSELPSSVRAFEAVAPTFDERFGAWASVAAQRRAVQRELLNTFPPGATLLELGGGTGEDALVLAAHGRRILITDGAPSMVAHAVDKARESGWGDRISGRQLLLQDVDQFAGSFAEGPQFDGVYSNFAALNCVADLSPVARGVARLLSRGAHALLVVFGPFAPGELVVELARAKPRDALRRLWRSNAARLGGHGFPVYYHTPGAVARSFAPYFRLARRRGIGILVPPSGAEPAASRFPGLVRLLEAMDRLLTAPLALLGDHVLLDLVRTDVCAPLAPGT